jgi:hypothetical protein
VIPKEIAPPPPRLAANSLRLWGKEFIVPGQGNFQPRQGIHEAGWGIGDAPNAMDRRKSTTAVAEMVSGSG